MALYLCGLPPSNPRVCVCAPVAQCVQRFETLWTVACQTPLSMDFSVKNTVAGCHFLLQGNLPNPGIEPTYPAFPALQADSLLTELLRYN